MLAASPGQGLGDGLATPAGKSYTSQRDAFTTLVSLITTARRIAYQTTNPSFAAP
jgi:hypothetical protein